MSETIGRLLAVGNVAEVFECGSRALKLYRSAVRKPTPFREAAIHATVETMGLPVPAVWGVQEVDGRWGIVFDRNTLLVCSGVTAVPSASRGYRLDGGSFSPLTHPSIRTSAARSRGL